MVQKTSNANSDRESNELVWKIVESIIWDCSTYSWITPSEWRLGKIFEQFFKNLLPFLYSTAKTTSLLSIQGICKLELFNKSSKLYILSRDILTHCIIQICVAEMQCQHSFLSSNGNHELLKAFYCSIFADAIMQ